MNLGIGENNVYYAIANFLVLFLVQFVYALVELLPSGQYPSMFELYRATITSLIATATFYGINRVRKSE